MEPPHCAALAPQLASPVKQDFTFMTCLGCYYGPSYGQFISQLRATLTTCPPSRPLLLTSQRALCPPYTIIAKDHVRRQDFSRTPKNYGTATRLLQKPPQRACSKGLESLKTCRQYKENREVPLEQTREVALWVERGVPRRNTLSNNVLRSAIIRRGRGRRISCLQESQRLYKTGVELSELEYLRLLVSVSIAASVLFVATVVSQDLAYSESCVNSEGRVQFSVFWASLGVFYTRD